MRWARTQSKSETITTWSSTHWSSHIHRMTATSLHTCCNSYTTYIHILRRHDSAFAHLQTCVMQQIDRFFPFSDRFTHIAITYRAVTALDSALSSYTTFTHTLRFTKLSSSGDAATTATYRSIWYIKSIGKL